jgi:DNA mismatch repair protein MLH3
VSPDGLTLLPSCPQLGKDAAAAARGPAAYLTSVALSPARVLAVGPREAHAARTHAEVLAGWGFGVEQVGGGAAVAAEPASGSARAVRHAGQAGATATAARSVPGALPSLTAAPAALRVTALPRLFDVALTVDDLREFLALLSDAPHAAVAPPPHEGGGVSGGDLGGDNGARVCRLYYAGCRPPAVPRVLNSKACRGAVMFGDTVTPAQGAAMLGRLQACRLPFQCAHGRPAMLPLVTLMAPQFMP